MAPERARIYLDHAATTPVRSEVVDAMAPYLGEGAYNPSSLHAEGRRARAALDDARRRVARVLQCKPREIVFCSSGTEADNLALIGAARAARTCGRHIVASAIEHHAVLRALDALRDDGYEISLTPVDASGTIDVHAFARLLRGDTTVAAVMYANNEIGTIQPIAELAELAHEHGALFLTDAVQAAGALPLDVAQLGIDLLTISAHKFGGPRGVGMLYVRDGTPLEPLLHGGGQEYGRRSGTENVGGAVGLAIALELAEAERAEYGARTTVLRDRLETGLLAGIPGLRVNGKAAARLPNITSVSISGIPVEPLLIGLDLEGVAVSAGSACATGSLEPSHVIAALGPTTMPSATLRFSLGRGTTSAEIERAMTVVPKVVSEQRRVEVPLYG